MAQLNFSHMNIDWNLFTAGERITALKEPAIIAMHCNGENTARLKF